MKGQNKTWGGEGQGTINTVEICKLPEKRIQNNNSKDDLRTWGKKKTEAKIEKLQ